MEDFVWADPPQRVAFPVARAGYPLIGAAAFATLILALLGLTVLSLLGLTATTLHRRLFPGSRPGRSQPARAGGIAGRRARDRRRDRERQSIFRRAGAKNQYFHVGLQCSCQSCSGGGTDLSDRLSTGTVRSRGPPGRPHAQRAQRGLCRNPTWGENLFRSSGRLDRAADYMLRPAG